MPLYDYRCPVHGDHEEFFHTIADMEGTPVRCEVCGELCERLLSKGARFTFAAGEFFEPYVDEDIHPEGKPIPIKSREHFFSECRKHGREFRKVRDKLR